MSSVNTKLPMFRSSTMKEYKRKMYNGQAYLDHMKCAIMMVIEGNRTCYSVAKEFNICSRTLYRYYRMVKNEPGWSIERMGFYTDGRVFNKAQETELVSCIMNSSNSYLDVTSRDIRILAYKCAKKFGMKMPASWETRGMAGEVWFERFYKRHNMLCFRTEDPNDASSEYMTPPHPDEFFDSILETIDKRKFERRASGKNQADVNKAGTSSESGEASNSSDLFESQEQLSNDCSVDSTSIPESNVSLALGSEPSTSAAAFSPQSALSKACTSAKGHTLCHSDTSEEVVLSEKELPKVLGGPKRAKEPAPLSAIVNPFRRTKIKSLAYEVCDFLSRAVDIDLSEIQVEKIIDEELTLDILPELNEADLEKLGFTPSSRKAILNHFMGHPEPLNLSMSMQMPFPVVLKQESDEEIITPDL